MPSWLPGDDYMTNFKVGDPYVKIDDGYARLPGAGYEALHPELKDVGPEAYPDIHKLRILADVAPYSREYNQGSLSFRATKNLAHAPWPQAPFPHCRPRLLSPAERPLQASHRGLLFCIGRRCSAKLPLAPCPLGSRFPGIWRTGLSLCFPLSTPLTSRFGFLNQDGWGD